MNNSSQIFASLESGELMLHIVSGELVLYELCGLLGAKKYMYNLASNPGMNFNNHFSQIAGCITYILTFLICVAGIVGNGMVIWLLGFRMKRNPFTTYVLNLAIADLGVLISSILGCIVVTIVFLSGTIPLLGCFLCAYVWALMYITDQLLLVVISIDRCVAVLFPLWHRCHRPPKLSRLVCASIWVLSLLIIGFDLFLAFTSEFTLLHFIVNVAICTPVMAISTIILFVKLCARYQQRKQGKLLPVISLALFLFLIFGIPVNYCYIVIYFNILDGTDAKTLTSRSFEYSELSFQEFLRCSSKRDLIIIPSMVAVTCTALNCSVNPLIYFLVGRKKKGQSRASMKVAIQRIFKEEENFRSQERPQSETQL